MNHPVTKLAQDHAVAMVTFGTRNIDLSGGSHRNHENVRELPLWRSKAVPARVDFTGNVPAELLQYVLERG